VVRRDQREGADQRGVEADHPAQALRAPAPPLRPLLHPDGGRTRGRGMSVKLQVQGLS
jgi:hypothetical protein